ncbi:hypothetical protein B0H12DRAFT_238905 [Mycena haematopus]|nr:hypothetical protein B0H12DRAFT_238905 [Mycena haematopus]
MHSMSSVTLNQVFRSEKPRTKSRFYFSVVESWMRKLTWERSSSQLDIFVLDCSLMCCFAFTARFLGLTGWTLCGALADFHPSK